MSPNWDNHYPVLAVLALLHDAPARIQQLRWEWENSHQPPRPQSFHLHVGFSSPIDVFILTASKDLFPTSSVSTSIAHVMRISRNNGSLPRHDIIVGRLRATVTAALWRAYCCGIGNALCNLSISVSTSMPGGSGPPGQLLQMHTFWGRQPAPVGRNDWPRGSINGMDPCTAHMEREKYRCIAICQLNCHVDRNPISHGRLNFLLLMSWFQTWFAPPLWSSRQSVCYTFSQHHGAYHLNTLKPEHSNGVDTKNLAAMSSI